MCNTRGRCAHAFAALAPGVHTKLAVARKLIIVVTAVLVPGGLIALLGAWLLKAFGQTESGKKVFEFARASVPSWAFGRAAERQAA